jgi:transcriptional regulator with XRE-family HTH domain
MKTSTSAAPGHSLSNQLRDVIDSRGLTAYALGKDAGVDPGVIQRFLNRERGLTMATADRLAEALGLRLVEVAARGRGRPRRNSGDKKAPGPDSSGKTRQRRTPRPALPTGRPTREEHRHDAGDGPSREATEAPDPTDQAASASVCDRG